MLKLVNCFTERDGLHCFSIQSPPILIVSTHEGTLYDVPRLFNLGYLPILILYCIYFATSHHSTTCAFLSAGYRELTNANTSPCTYPAQPQYFHRTKHRQAHASTNISRPSTHPKTRTDTNHNFSTHHILLPTSPPALLLQILAVHLSTTYICEASAKPKSTNNALDNELKCSF